MVQMLDMLGDACKVQIRTHAVHATVAGAEACINK